MNLDEFSNYLEIKHKVHKNRIPFYINWVRSFLHHCDGKIDFENPSKQIDLFLIHTGKRYEQWQVNQAQEAIRLYCYFAGKTDKNNAPKDLYSVKDWKSAGDRMIRMLRLKQLAYKTEQSYMKWLRDFYAYVKPTSPNVLTDHHLMEFLSYLAVETPCG